MNKKRSQRFPLCWVAAAACGVVLFSAISFSARAASLEVTHGPATGGPGTFAVEEIRREALAHGMTVADDATGTRVALTVGAEGHAAAQSYSIRVQNEGMPHKMDSRAKEAWLWDTYGEGVRDALKDEPKRAFDMTGDKAEHGKSLRHLVAALDHWKRYAALRDAQYVPALYSRVGYVGVTELTEKVAADLEIARNWKPGTLQDDNKRSDTEKGFRK